MSRYDGISKRVGRAFVADVHLVERRLRGIGWDEAGALDDALEKDNYLHGFYGGRKAMKSLLSTTQVLKPRPARNTKVLMRDPRRGEVQKRYILIQARPKKTELTHDSRFIAKYKKSSDALSAAKAVALEYNEEIVIKIAAFCQGDTEWAFVLPDKNEIGEWEFQVVFYGKK